MDVIFEVGIRRIKDLEKIDMLFYKLKMSKDKFERNKILREFEIELEKIFSVSVFIEYHHFGSYSQNFAIAPEIKINKDVKIKEYDDFVKFVNVKRVNLIFGNDFIKMHTPAELTAILLHEIGHLTNYISTATNMFFNIMRSLYLISRPFQSLPIIGTIFYPIFLLTSRSLNFREHIGEYEADKFAVKYGYGDELISAINKWKNQEIKHKSSFSLLERLSMLQDLITKTDHPDNDDRILKITELMKKTYADKYNLPKIQKLLNSYKV
jgi:hypothetical protein